MTEAAVDLVGVTKSYRAPGGGRRTVLRDVSLRIEAGTSVGLVGPSGAGKTTLAHLLLGTQPPDRGEVRVFGYGTDRRSGAARRAWPTLVQIVWQDPGLTLNPYRTVRQTLDEALAVNRCVARDWCVETLMDIVELPSSLAVRRPHELSGGQRQRVALARALAPRPRLLILDEAVASFDLPLQLGIVDMLAALRRSVATTLLWVAHDLALTERLCDVIVLLHDGTIVERATPSGFLRAPESPAGRALVAAHRRLCSWPWHEMLLS